ncbi:hypothetical protein CWI38_1693p0010 [Hamiltosporidium tvaerminnensis]|uniref:Cyclin n=1 Tax=Hamiltosporidium tvaerminnensis TaxID=1176355 RepID=A0A4Q9LR41_9MICR|nr:hypothetical protein CWI38_1693p0010 [Hamiltosporidium tvaerminnensis]
MPSITFSEDEKILLLKYCRMQIIKICRQFSLPYTVHSTSSHFIRNIFYRSDISEYSIDNLITAAIFLGCKSEDINIELSLLLKNNVGLNESLIFQYELLLAQYSDYRFSVSCPYLRMLGCIILLQEKDRVVVKRGQIDINNVSIINTEIKNVENNSFDYEDVLKNIFFIEDINIFWRKSVINLDKIIIMSGFEKITATELALSSLDLPVKYLHSLLEKTDTKRIEEIRNSYLQLNIPDSNVISLLKNKIRK